MTLPIHWGFYWLSKKIIELFPDNKTGYDMLKYAAAMKQKNNRSKD